MAGEDFSRLVFEKDGLSIAYLLYGDQIRKLSSEPPGAAPTAPTETILMYPPTRAPQNVSYHGGLLGGGLPGALPIQLSSGGPGGTMAPPLGLRCDRASSSLRKRWWQVPTSIGWTNTRVVPHPTYRGSVTVTGPASPASYTGDNAMQLVLDLIDNNTFPEPDDDNGRIGYFVMMPAGTTSSAGRRRS
jgi:hypothetical protein